MLYQLDDLIYAMSYTQKINIYIIDNQPNNNINNIVFMGTVGEFNSQKRKNILTEHYSHLYVYGIYSESADTIGISIDVKYN